VFLRWHEQRLGQQHSAANPGARPPGVDAPAHPAGHRNPSRDGQRVSEGGRHLRARSWTARGGASKIGHFGRGVHRPRSPKTGHQGGLFASVVLPPASPNAGQRVEANLHVPERTSGLVIFAHGSGSSRFSSRNRAVAEYLQRRRLGTLLLDLLTREEEVIDNQTREYRFDIDRLGARMILATDWAQRREDLRKLAIGYFGASTGAAAALIAAAERPAVARAVVSRGGRPDLAGTALPKVSAPTLLIVGGHDEPVIEMNREAKARMRAPVQLEIVPGATHLFEEPGTLAAVERLAGDWFTRYLQPETHPAT
jgi:putative phosphoribosyl transferase